MSSPPPVSPASSAARSSAVRSGGVITYRSAVRARRGRRRRTAGGAGHTSPCTVMAPAARGLDLLERRAPGHMHHVRGRAGQLGQHQEAMDALGLQLDRPAARKRLETELSPLDQLPRQHVDDAAVLAVGEHHHAQLGRLLHHREGDVVVGLDAELVVGEPQLDAAHPQRGDVTQVAVAVGTAAPRSPRGRRGRSATRASRRPASAGPPRPGVSPGAASTNASAEVVPPTSAERVSSRIAPNTCVCTSIAPGSTRHPSASTTLAPAASTSPTRTITPPLTRTSARTEPRGLTTVPPRITVLAGNGVRAVAARRSAGAGCSRRRAPAAPARPGRSRTARRVSITSTVSATQATTPRLWVMNSMLRRSSVRSSASSSSTAACTDTSSAEVTSSQTSRSGSRASARAIATRWRSPPESSIGKRSPSRGGSSHPVEQLAHLALGIGPGQPAQHPQRPLDRGRHPVPRVERLERVLEHDLDPPARSSGAVAGERRAALLPSNTMRPPLGSCRPAMQRPIVVLPLPDSPTSATQRPDSIPNDDVVDDGARRRPLRYSTSR